MRWSVEYNIGEEIMTDEQLEKILKDIGLLDCRPIIEGYIFHIKKLIRCRVSRGDGTYGYSVDEYEFLIIANEGEKQGIILRCGTSDLHWFVLRKWRNQGVLSNALRTNVLARVWPENKTVTCCYSWRDKMVDRPRKYMMTKHLADIAGLQLMN